MDMWAFETHGKVPALSFPRYTAVMDRKEDSAVESTGPVTTQTAHVRRDSPLLRLPVELRLEILTLALFSHLQEYFPHSRDLHERRRLSSPAGSPLLPPLAQTCQ